MVNIITRRAHVPPRSYDLQKRGELDGKIARAITAKQM